MTALEAAAHPSTAAPELERLAISRDLAVRALVASNPNVSLAVLERLSVRHAGAVLLNPVLDLLGLEDANWVARLPEFARLSLLRHPACPKAWLEAALLGTGQRDALAAIQNPACPRALLEGVTDPEALGAAALHINRSAPLEPSLDELMRREAASLERDSEALKDAAAVRILPAWLLGALSLSDDLELALLAARHPDSDASTLERLAFHMDPEVRGAVLKRDLPPELRGFIERAGAEGPLTNADAERLLATEHGRWLVARRGAGAQLGGLIGDADWRVRQALAQNTALTPHDLARLENDLDKDVLCAVAAHPRTPKSALARLLLSAHEEVRTQARANEAAPQALKASLHKIETGDPALSPAALERLARRDDALAQLAARHPNASPALLRFLSVHNAWQVREAVARSAHATLEMLQALATDHDYDVRAAVAIHPHLTPTLLESFSRDAHPLVRSAVALNARTPLALLERLAGDSDPDVRQAVAVSPQISPSLLETLAADALDAVRRAVALNPICPAGLLERLSSDSDAEVRAVVADHQNAPRNCAIGLFGADFEWQELYKRVNTGADVLESELSFLAGLNEFALTLSLSHPHCPNDVLERLAGDEDWKLRQRVAQHPNTAPAVLERLGLDGDYEVRTAVAQHAATPRGTLMILSRDDQAAVRKAVAGRADLAPLISEILAWDEDDDVLRSLQKTSDLREMAQTGTPLEPNELMQLLEIGTPLALRLCASNEAADGMTLRILSTSADWRVRLEVAKHSASPVDTLERLCADADSDVRRAVAGNPSTPAALLLRLLHDDERSVARTALGNSTLPLEAIIPHRRAALIRNQTLQGFNRLIALEHPDLPRSEFRKMRNLHALLWLERLALTRNPNAPRAALEVLAEDANQFVRAAARSKLETLNSAALEVLELSRARGQR